jgi:hypothetical protein
MDQDSGRWSLRKLALPRLPVKFSDLAVGILLCGAAAAILINAMALQSGPHPAPLFLGKAAKAAAEPTGSVVTILPRPRPPELEAARAAAATNARAKAEPSDAALKSPMAPPGRMNAAGIKRTNSIPEPAAAPKQLAAVQRALADFGYGQIKPNGVVDAETRAAIEKFERERKLPVTGQVSERVVRELAAMTGRALN